jgi:hypothetical protein
MDPLWANRLQLGSPSPDVVAAVERAHLLIERLGHWPTFEDFEVLSLQFDRGNLMKIFETSAWTEQIEPNLTAVFYGFDIRYSPTHPDRKPILITMRFHGSFERFALDGFNHQNPICGLAMAFEYSENLRRNLFAVDWGGTGVHHDASFTCERVEVVAVEA